MRSTRPGKLSRRPAGRRADSSDLHLSPLGRGLRALDEVPRSKLVAVWRRDEASETGIGHWREEVLDAVGGDSSDKTRSFLIGSRRDPTGLEIVYNDHEAAAGRAAVEELKRLMEESDGQSSPP